MAEIHAAYGPPRARRPPRRRDTSPAVRPTLAFPLALLSLVALAACGSSGGTTGSSSTTGGTGGASTTAGSGGTSNTGGASAGTGGAAGTTSTGTGGATATGTGGSGGAPGIMSCAEIGADDCFSNLDCIAADRCEDQGGASLAVPCCVPGMRGTGVLGDPCTIDDDCATSLCIETPGGYLCSGECTQPADCIPALPDCTKIPAILGKGAFCLPP